MNQEKCPKCGEVWPINYACGPEELHSPDSPVCLRRQLDQSQARVRELEAAAEAARGGK
jgi:hypothetical protein